MMTVAQGSPERDEAAKLGSGGGLEVAQVTGDSSDSAQKIIATAIAGAARLGIECHEVADGNAWLLRHASGAGIGRVNGRDALIAAVAGFEAARADVQALVMQLGRSL